MVYLLNMVIFHGYVSHNQMVIHSTSGKGFKEVPWSSFPGDPWNRQKGVWSETDLLYPSERQGGPHYRSLSWPKHNAVWATNAFRWWNIMKYPHPLEITCKKIKKMAYSQGPDTQNITHTIGGSIVEHFRWLIPIRFCSRKWRFPESWGYP